MRKHMQIVQHSWCQNKWTIMIISVQQFQVKEEPLFLFRSSWCVDLPTFLFFVFLVFREEGRKLNAMNIEGEINLLMVDEHYSAQLPGAVSEVGYQVPREPAYTKTDPHCLEREEHCTFCSHWLTTATHIDKIHCMVFFSFCLFCFFVAWKKPGLEIKHSQVYTCFVSKCNC